MLSKAIEFAAKAHAGQTDKGGNPYILHPLRVLINFCDSESEATRICAVLHDVVEDTGITLDDLREEGFSEEVLSALDCLTKREHECYDDFISRVITNEIACRVKSGDLADNMDLTRIPDPSQEDKERIMKYKKAASRVSDAYYNFSAKSRNGGTTTDYRVYEITGTVEVPYVISEDQLLDMYIRFVESHGWFFCGGFKDITGEADKQWDK